MSKKLNHSLALGIFLIGIFSANVSQGQTNAYWDVNGVTAGTGGTGTNSSSGVYWTTNSANATGNGGGPVGGGTFAVGNGAANSTATYTTNGATWTSNSGAYNFNFGGDAGTVTWGGTYQAYGVNLLTSGYTWTIDGTGANNRSINTTNGVNLNGNALTLANGSRGVNSFTFSGPTAATAVGFTGTSGSTLTLRNLTADSSTNSFTILFSGGTISSSIGINVDIGAGSKISLGSQSSSGLTINSAMTLNTNASGVALNITNSAASGVVALNGVVSGANGLVLDNTAGGKIQLNAANTYQGGTTLNNIGGGEIIFSNATSFGTGTITSSGSGTNYVRSAVNNLNLANAQVINAGNTLRMAGTTASWNLTNSGQISGAGAFQYNAAGNMYLTGVDNSFAGGVTLGSSGTLYISKFGMSGANSSLGTNGTITVGVASQGAGNGTLRWTGTADEISDKVINLNSSTNGANIYAGGAANATLTLNGAIVSVASGSKSFNFQGADTNTLVINGVINENGGVNSVVIGGANSGTVVLGNNANSFSGAVLITNSTGARFTILETANIGNTGANSALGKNGTINIGGTTATALTTLKYTGTGETSDKVINLTGIGTGGAILDQSGTNGLLKFTSAMTATGAGAKTVTLQGSTAGTGEIAGAITNLGGNVISLNKSGSGKWTLSGANTYDGATAVNSGVLNIQNGSALGSATAGTTVAAGSQLQLQGGITVNNEALGLSGSNGATASLRNISGNNTYNGTITFTSGTNRIDSDAGTLLLSSFATGNALTSSKSLVVGGSGNTTFSGSFVGSSTSSITKEGTGTLTLANTNFDIGGGVLVNNGKLDLATNNALGATRAVVINGGTLDITTFNNTVGAVTLTNGTIAGTTGVLTGTSYAVEGGTISARLGGGGALTKSGLGTVTLSGSNSYSGNTVIASAGVLKLQSTDSLSKNSSLLGASGSANTGTLDLNADGNYVANSFGTALTGGFNMNFTNSSGSAATLTFTNGENYLTIASNSSASRALTNLSSNLDIRFDGNLEIGSTLLHDKAIEFAGPGSFRVNGAVKNSGSAVRGLLKTGSGTLTLAGTGNDYNGTTAVDVGTLLLTNSATLTGSTALTVSTSGYTDSSSSGRTVNAALNLASGSSLLSGSTTTVYSGGNLIVNGTAGAVVVQTNGLVGGSGTVGSINLERGAFLTPGNSPGTLNATSASLLAGSTYNWEIQNAAGGPSAAGTNWDLLNVTDVLNLSTLTTLSGGQLNLVLKSLDSDGLGTTSLSGFTIDTAYSWVFAQAGSIDNANFTVGADVTDYFNINTTAFNNDALPASYFKVEVGETTVGGSTLKTLQLMSIPEPSTGSMFGLGLAGLVVTRLLRRKNS
jgi:fibronectin-binding autotransporter adhesin